MNIFEGIFDTDLTTTITITQFLLCMLMALIAGYILATAYSYKGLYTKSFVVTLAILPAVVCVVIMMVNGNVGTGVAVAGAFSLVRFRSVPGTAKEIGAIFIAMGTGLMMGMGYLAYGMIFTFILSGFTLFYTLSNFGENKNMIDKTLTITIPEDLNYSTVFDDIMELYTKSHKITFVKTTNMGSLFKITYNIQLRDANLEKEFIDALRCRNGNLEIAVSPMQHVGSEL
ncbi:MAG: DUF4956 domain-containing protein [Eubacteriales bacterium]